MPRSSSPWPCWDVSFLPERMILFRSQLRPISREPELKRLVELALLMCGLLSAAPALADGDAVPRVSEVMVVATMHGLHLTSPTYSYDDLYQLVSNFKPTS